jgi:hypothetical protein
LQDRSTDFEFLPIDVSLARCLRYFYLHANKSIGHEEIGVGGYYTSSQVFCNFQFPVRMRTAPSLYLTTGTDYYVVYRNGATDNLNSFFSGNATFTQFGLANNSEASGTAGDSAFFRAINASAVIGADAEL